MPVRSDSKVRMAQNTECHSPAILRGKGVPELVTAHALAAPSAIAVTHGQLSLTYSDLDQRASQLAHVLQSFGVGSDIIVPLYLNRSLAMIVGALAVLKAGGAYLPLDPTYPKERVAFFLNDVQAQILVTGRCSVDVLPTQSEHIITLDSEGRLLGPPSFEPIVAEVKPENLAYVIYTSGSTGRPKGVELTHGGLLNLVLWHQRAFGVSPSDRASHLAALSFDAAVWELWPYLASGASVHLPNGVALGDPEAVRDWLVSRKISICFLPTPLAEHMMRLEWPKKSTLRLMLTGADTLHRYPPQQLPFEVVNTYGPTECTVVATSGTVFSQAHPDRLPTIGRPIDNTQIYILNEKLEEVPIGEIGEIYIGGEGLARGYHNRPDLTAEKFLPNPFCTASSARLYKTGDLARYLPDGQIAFLGRIDEQIKIRGFRIEPEEIVNVLNEHPAVQANAVVARESESGDKHLVAYLVLNQDVQLSRTQLREFAASRLPEHMLPAEFVTLPALPLTPSGKIDRSLLPDPTAHNSLHDVTFVAPTTPVEEKLASIVSQLLGMEQVSVDDNFFLLGGHSLLGTQLIAAIRDMFEVEIPLRTLFELPTVGELAAEIERLLITKIQGMSEDEVNRVLKSSRHNNHSLPPSRIHTA